MNEIRYEPNGVGVPNSKGHVSIWEMPIPGERYYIGADAAEGIRGGDFSAACVVKGSDCSLVATYRGHVDPHSFGEDASRLGYLYNGGVLAIETFPAAHGQSAFDSALAYGYPRLYLREVLDTIERSTTMKPGWRTDGTTKPRMIDRVRVALGGEGAIPDEELLTELLAIRFQKRGDVRSLSDAVYKAVTSGHDDLFDAYAIALLVRDGAFVRPQQRAREEAAPVTLQQRAWELAGLRGRGRRSASGSPHQRRRVAYSGF